VLISTEVGRLEVGLAPLLFRFVVKVPRHQGTWKAVCDAIVGAGRRGVALMECTRTFDGYNEIYLRQDSSRKFSHYKYDRREGKYRKEQGERVKARHLLRRKLRV
jgi:hypothetical protein